MMFFTLHRKQTMKKVLPVTHDDAGACPLTFQLSLSTLEGWKLLGDHETDLMPTHNLSPPPPFDICTLPDRSIYLGSRNFVLGKTSHPS